MKTYLSILLLLIMAFTPALGQEALPPEALADPDGQFIEIDGARIYYIERGSPDAPTVLLLHGFGGSTFTWRYALDTLAEAGYHVIAYDRPPFGLADKHAGIATSGDAQAAQTAAFMDALGIETATLVGHSAGGRVIAHFAVNYPQRVDSLVFVAGAVGSGRDLLPGASNGDRQTGNLASLFEFADRLDPESPLLQELVRQFITPDRYAETLQASYYDPDTVTSEIIEGYSRFLRVEGWEAGFISLLSAVESLFDDLDMDALARVAVPVLIIWGEEDAIVPIQVGTSLHEIIPGAQWITYPKVGHMPMEENIEQFGTDLLAFIEQVYAD